MRTVRQSLSLIAMGGLLVAGTLGCEGVVEGPLDGTQSGEGAATAPGAPKTLFRGNAWESWTGAPSVMPELLPAAQATTPAPGEEQEKEQEAAPAPAAPSPSTPPSAPASTGTVWLRTSGSKIVREDGTVWRGRGANLHDTRSCNACTYSAPNVAEVKRRIDELVDVWKANFIRLALESYGNSGVLQDSQYLEDVKEIVAHIGKKKGVYVLLSLWIDPTFNSMGWPTSQTHPVWVKLAHTFKDAPHVMYGLVNEPQNNFDGALDAQVWRAMNDTVEVIRNAEKAVNARPHIVAVQGTGGWSRRLDYYVGHPITAGGGQNVAYEVHVYDPQRNFQKMFEEPARTLPVIIGEFGPMHSMTEADCGVLMDRAEALDVPYLAWTFHMRCPPNLLVDNSQNGCGVGMQLTPTPWGRLLKDRLARPW